MLERRFGRDVASLSAIVAFVREFLAAHGLPDRHAHALDLVAEELFTNVVKYNHGEGDVLIGLSWRPPDAVMIVRDFGVEPWDVTRAAPVDTTAPLAARRAGGLGLHLVRQIADRIEYAYQDRNSTITVTKRLEP